MVKHIVLWKIKDSADKQQNIDRMIEMLTSLVGKIDGLVSVEMLVREMRYKQLTVQYSFHTPAALASLAFAGVDDVH